PGRLTPGTLRGGWLPDRRVRTRCAVAGIDGSRPGHRLTRPDRVALARALMDMPLPVTGDRGFGYAEVTAGGVPLSEVRLETMESRVSPGFYLSGEICDVVG